MESSISAALAAGGIADITTIGAKSGAQRRKEIYFHTFDGEHYIGGRPGFKRDWLANLTANPQFTLHLKRGVTADLNAVAEPIRDPSERGAILYRMLTENWGTDPERARADLDRWVATSPLVRFEVLPGGRPPGS
jgi:hypothetical protein